jgi:protein associated with RNAse G/E
MWKYGDVIVWRGIYRNRIWHAIPTIVVRDAPQEVVLLILPGANCMVEKDYAAGKGKNGKRRWNFRDEDWNLENFRWHTNRVLFVVEPQKYYSIMHFWNHASDEFLGYYVNFQQPYQRNAWGIDAIDLDLDLDIEPDLSFRWKDEDDYEQAIEHGIITPEWVQGIENAKPEILERLEKRKYPFDSSWLNWMPDPGWSAPTLPENWDKM